jgi:hypothetical protein
LETGWMKGSLSVYCFQRGETALWAIWSVFARGKRTAW